MCISQRGGFQQGWAHLRWEQSSDYYWVGGFLASLYTWCQPSHIPVYIPNKPPTVIGVRGGHRGEGGIHLPHLLFLQCNVIRQWDPTKSMRNLFHCLHNCFRTASLTFVSPLSNTVHHCMLWWILELGSGLVACAFKSGQIAYMQHQ